MEDMHIAVHAVSLVGFPKCSVFYITPLCNRPSGYFTPRRQVCGFPGANFTYPAYIICVCLKKANQQPDRQGHPGGKFADPVTFFSQNLPLGLLQRGVVKVTAICEEHNFFPPHFYRSSRRGEFRMSTHPKSWLINSQLQ